MRTYLMAGVIGAVAQSGFAQADATRMLQAAVVAEGLVLPTAIASAPGDRSRLFVAELGTTQPFRLASVRVVDLSQRSVLAEPFLTTVVQIGAERGLLGLTFHPDYPSNGHVYIHHTSYQPEGSRVARFTVSQDPNRVNPASEEQVFFEAQTGGTHQAGWIEFGPDGMLYFSIGDAKLAGNGQRNTNALGKVLRIDVSTHPYTVPPSNPLVGVPGAREEIWAIGLRNPWRCAFDPVTGELWIGDVGDRHEELNLLPPGDPPPGQPENFGWPCSEGPTKACHGVTVTLPVLHWPHPGVSEYIVGGRVYRGAAMPWLRGAYFFWRRGNSTVWSMRHEGGAITDLTNWTDSLTTPTGPLDRVVTFGEDAAGELYMAEFLAGRVFRIEPRCWANCDGSTSPILDVDDFLCFMHLFQIGDAYACDCDTTTGVGLCDVFDLLCFANAFAGGCS